MISEGGGGLTRNKPNVQCRQNPSKTGNAPPSLASLRCYRGDEVLTQMSNRSSLFLLLPLLLAAKKPEATVAPDNTNTATKTSTTEGTVTTVKIDFNNDGRPEIINYYQQVDADTKWLQRKEIDLNRDGRVDVVTEFDSTGQMIREQMDGDFDGRIDWRDTYKNGRRAVSEVDTDYNGSFDVRKEYENGVVRRKWRDTNGDQTPDFLEILDERGNVTQTGQDTNGDGKIDERQN